MKSAHKIFSAGLAVAICFGSSVSWAAMGSVSDDFNRDSTASATSETAPNPIGTHYSIESGTWRIFGGTLDAEANGILIDNRLQNLRYGSYDFTLTVDARHPSSTTSQSVRTAGVVLNYQDLDNHYIIRWGYETDGMLGHIQIVKRQNGSNSAIGDRVTGLDLPASVYLTWTFASSENENEILYCVSQIGSLTPIYEGSFTDSAFTNGYAGFYRAGSSARFDNYSLRVLDTDLFSNEIAVSYDLYGRNYRFYENQPHLPPDPGMQLEGEVTLFPEQDGEAEIIVNALFTGREGQETEMMVFNDTLQLVSGLPVSVPVHVALPPQAGRVVLSTQSSDPGIIFTGNVTETPVYASPIVPAFPGATGFGAFTPGGRGGKVYQVTTLEDYAAHEAPVEGSLRYAVEQTGARIVLFAVSGDIRLKRELIIANPRITIAGNTAPFPGVSITGYQTSLRTDHAVLRYLRFRLSTEILRERFADGNHSEWDSFQAVGGEYVLLDHLSGSHSVDETLSMTRMDRASMQHCLSAYSLNSVFHPKWPEAHNFGGLTAYIGRPDRHAVVSSIYNAWINHDRRMPGLSAVEDPDNLASRIDLRHSLMYNWGSNAAGSEAPAREEWRQNYHLNFVGNYLKPGPETPPENRYAGLTVRGALNKLYMESNIHDQDIQNDQPTNQEGLVKYIYSDVSSDHFLSEAVPSPCSAAPEIPGLAGILTDFVGASLPARDSVDAAAVLDVLNGTGYYPYVDMDIDTSPLLPDLSSIRHVYHNEEDVFPVWWKRMQGLADDAEIDPHADENGDGYTNVEKYMYGLNLSDPAVLWAVPANNINPLDRLTGEETAEVRTPGTPGIGWADRDVNETVFSGADGLVVMSSSTDDGAAAHGVRNLLDPGSAAWSSGGPEAVFGPAGARVEEGFSLVFAFSIPRKINEILIHRTDLNSYPPAHDPAGALLQGLKGWPDHWVDLAEAGDWPVFSSEYRMHRLEVPKALQGPYAAYRLIFSSAHGAEDLRIQHVTFDSSDLCDVQADLNDEARGSVSGVGLYAKNALATLMPEPAEYFIFSHWSGDVPPGQEAEAPLIFSADINRVLTAHFAERITEGTHTPHWWLAEYGLTEPSFEEAARMDHNGNGHSASEEFIAGIDPGPLGSQDLFQFNSILSAGDGLLFSWPGREGRRYTLQSTVRLTHPFSDVVGAEDLPATPPLNEWMMDAYPDEKNRFFRLRVRYPR